MQKIMMGMGLAKSIAIRWNNTIIVKLATYERDDLRLTDSTPISISEGGANLFSEPALQRDKAGQLWTDVGSWAMGVYATP